MTTDKTDHEDLIHEAIRRNPFGAPALATLRTLVRKVVERVERATRAACQAECEMSSSPLNSKGYHEPTVRACLEITNDCGALESSDMIRRLLLDPPQPKVLDDSDLAEQFRRGYEAGQKSLPPNLEKAIRELGKVWGDERAYFGGTTIEDSSRIHAALDTIAKYGKGV